MPVKTQYYTASSLDGFIAGPDHSLDWLLQFGSVEETSFPSFIRDVGAVVMGAHTYEWILRNGGEGEPGATPDDWPYEQPAWVFTTRALRPVPGADIRFVRGDVRAVHDEMKQASAGKNIWIVGGGDLAGQFYDAGLLDEIIVQVAPVTLGRGMPLLPRRITERPLRLTSVQSYGGVFVELRYEVPRPDGTGDGGAGGPGGTGGTLAGCEDSGAPSRSV